MSKLKQAERSHIYREAGAKPVTLSGDDGEQLGSAAATPAFDKLIDSLMEGFQPVFGQLGST